VPGRFGLSAQIQLIPYMSWICRSTHSDGLAFSLDLSAYRILIQKTQRIWPSVNPMATKHRNTGPHGG